MPEAPRPLESLQARLFRRVTEIRNEAVDTWAGLTAPDSVKAVTASIALAMFGMTIATLAGNDPVLIAIRSLGGIYIAGGGVGMVAGVVKSLELETARKTK